MAHEQMIRIVPGAKTAVLMIHGICGTPDHFRTLIPLEQEIPDDWSLCNIILYGHCKKVEDFGRSSMKKWKAQVWQIFDELCQSHERVILVGHSMGTLFSIQLALERPEKIGFLFLLGVPVKVRVRLNGIRNLLRLPFGLLNLNDSVQKSLHSACGMNTTKMLWKYVPWAPRMVELLVECHATGKVLDRLRVPCIAWQSGKDEMVSPRAGMLLKESGRIQVQTLGRSTHFYYAPEDVEKIIESFRSACKEYRK